MADDINQGSVTKFLGDCLGISGVSAKDDMQIEVLGEGAFIALANNNQRFLVVVQELEVADQDQVRSNLQPISNEPQPHLVHAAKS